MKRIEKGDSEYAMPETISIHFPTSAQVLSGHWYIRISPAVTTAELGQSSDLPASSCVETATPDSK